VFDRLGQPQCRQRLDEADGLDADVCDLAEEADDVGRVVGAVGVARDAGALVGLDAVLIGEPVEGGAVAEAVAVRLRRRSVSF